MASKAVKKIAYDKKLCQLLDEYTQILIAAVGNVGSNQLQNIRQRLRGDFVFLMGKNTIMKRSIRIHAEKTGNNAFLIQIPVLVGNVGLISTKGNLKEVSEEVAKYKIALDQKRVLYPPTRLAQQVKLQQYQLIEQLQHPLRRFWHLLL
ncbi:large ribosomal subunit protein uL10-like [Rhododendron vialii]|uniref:large ribosomal subunit protein uL10-like n=1 Tax=Rhododendron vialii TaxID=182163 RepID=UPI00265E9294|nr:large ribosomal subunit protein uL10-like [Rhododendron vialii]